VAVVPEGVGVEDPQIVEAEVEVDEDVVQAEAEEAAGEGEEAVEAAVDRGVGLFSGNGTKKRMDNSSTFIQDLHHQRPEKKLQSAEKPKSWRT
jgi:hypothetical protein